MVRALYIGLLPICLAWGIIVHVPFAFGQVAFGGEPSAAPAALAPAAKLLQEAINAKVFPGCTVAVGASRGPVWIAAFGKLDYEHEDPVTAETQYDLASLTKVVGTTSVILTLVSDGKLELGAPVEKYLPEFVTSAANEQERERRRKVTVEHLLTHSAGLVSWKPLFKSAKGYDQILAAALAAPLENEPGTRESYSDLGIIVLGELTARVGGKKLAELERERIFGPLQMKNTSRNPPAELLPRIAPTERRDNAEGYWRGTVHDENARAAGGLTGHAGLFSTAGDMSIWAGEWLKALRGQSRTFPRELAEKFIARRGIVPGSSRAIGWDTPSDSSSAGKLFSRRSFGHTGFTGTSVWIDPERDGYVILLTNAVHPQRGKPGTQAVRRKLADAVATAVDSKTLVPDDSRPTKDDAR